MEWRDLFSSKKKESVQPVVQRLPEDDMFNPLKAYRGGYIEVVDPMGDNITYLITEIAECTRRICGEHFKFTDYLISDKDKNKIIRVNPVNSDIPGDYDILLLEPHYEGEFDEALQDAMRMSELYEDTDKGRITYYSIGNNRDGYLTHVRYVHLNNNVIRDKTMKYWDYTRKPDANLGEITGSDIFLFVNIDQDDGYITMWQGVKITRGELNIYSSKA